MSADTQFSTGAVRSADANHLDFMSISPIAMIALARTCQEGAAKYGHHNWELGMDAIDLLNHVKRHLTMWEAGDRSEPHLPHALWGLHAAVHMDTLHPELSAPRRRGPGCSVTPEMRAHLAEAGEGLAAKRKAGFFAGLGRWVLDQVAEVRQILAGVPREARDIRVSAESSMSFGAGAEFAPPSDDEEVYRGTVVEGGRGLRSMLRTSFHVAGITDSDITDPAIADEDATAEMPALRVADAPPPGIKPRFEKLPRRD